LSEIGRAVSVPTGVWTSLGSGYVHYHVVVLGFATTVGLGTGDSDHLGRLCTKCAEAVIRSCGRFMDGRKPKENEISPGVFLFLKTSPLGRFQDGLRAAGQGPLGCMSFDLESLHVRAPSFKPRQAGVCWVWRPAKKRRGVQPVVRVVSYLVVEGPERLDPHRVETTSQVEHPTHVRCVRGEMTLCC
jgi:hypothetical protein